MKWMTSKEFWNIIPKSKEKIENLRLDNNAWCYFQAYEEDVQKLIGDMQPNYTPWEEEDFPGPVSRWYGELDGIYFLFDFHHASPNGTFVNIRHDFQEGAREIIRAYFKNWGDDWQESE